MSRRLISDAVVIVIAWLWHVSYGVAAVHENKQDSIGVKSEVIAISMDNDLFVPGSASDVDFTGGLAVTYSGYGQRDFAANFDNALAVFDRFSGMQKSNETPFTTSIEFGMYGFTPQNVKSTQVLLEDRPYASLVYLSASRVYAADEMTDDAFSSSLTLGVLGLNLFGDLQNTLHELTGSERVRGWQHQVSEGGEMTFRYQGAYHDYWRFRSERIHLKTTYFASIGYLTEAGIALSTRQGLISSPSHRFNPELIAYGERVHDVTMAADSGDESYFWGGLALKARFYNVFLQGQFRRSEHTLNRGELRPLIAEAWLGYTVNITGAVKFSYFLRAQSSEIRRGMANRNLIWGGFSLSRSF